jgi:hypothetical protein
VLSLLLFLGCSKDSSNQLAPNNPINTITLSAEEIPFEGIWKNLKNSDLEYEDGYNIGSRIQMGSPEGLIKIRFSKDIFPNTTNSKTVYDDGTGLPDGKLVDFLTKQKQTWSVFNKDSLSIGNIKYSIKKITATELELQIRKDIATNKYRILTWYLVK